ncbi:hypothetical protein [Ascidiimonas sp. W6]|uniref:hypothetical protein n=1 Tax=Ascidiimonas meishanensis TaxID=3128903 RepID=UPI0030EC1BB6
MEIGKVIVILMMILSAGCKGQHEELSIPEKEAFLVGMFNFSSGTNWVKEHPVLKNRVNFLFPGKEKLIEVVLDTLASYEKQSGLNFIIKKEDFVEIYREEGEENPFLRFFEEERSADMFYYDETLDKDFEIVVLKLKPEAFKTQNEKLYFLLGAFINCGRTTENDYSYTYPDENYMEVISGLLEQTGSTIVVKEKKREAMPGYDKVIFKPSKNLKTLLILYKELTNN